MITFELNEEQSMIREALQGFAAEVLAPGARAIDEAGEMPSTIIQQGWDFGLIAAAIPEAYGGGGGDRSCMTNAVALEALGGGCASQAAAIMAPDPGLKKRQRSVAHKVESTNAQEPPPQ
jgi:alkylation response protein AidB-like acyl-CoA dehydrogenase